MARDEIANLLIEHSAALYRVEKYERRIIEAIRGIDAPVETLTRFLVAAGVGDAEGYNLAEAMHLLYELFQEGGAE